MDEIQNIFPIKKMKLRGDCRRVGPINKILTIHYSHELRLANC